MSLSKNEVRIFAARQGLTLLERRHGDQRLFRVEGSESGWYSLSSVARQIGFIETTNREEIAIASAVAGQLYGISSRRQRDIRDALRRIRADNAYVIDTWREMFMEYVVIEAYVEHTPYRAVVYLDDTEPLEWRPVGEEWNVFDECRMPDGTIYHVKK